MVERTCAYCGRSWTPAPNNAARARYCSPRCNRIGERKKFYTERTCLVCGRIWAASRKDGQYCSRPCYAEAKRIRLSCSVPWATCEECGRWWMKHRTSRRCAACRRRPQRRWVMGWCRRCGATFITFQHAVHCSSQCSRQAHRERHDARKRDAYVEDVWRLRVYERDGWRCQLCGKKVQRNVDPHHPLAPSLDHVVPLALGGIHAPANVQLAHLRCNSLKGARVGDLQLRLLG